jgi:SAM-dependent methyltransferase
MSRIHIINAIINHVNATKYLEIGISDGFNFKHVNCSYKIGVDPDINSPAIYHLTSDDFFEKNKETFDVIFLDGLHHSDQLERDIYNSLKILNKNGVILCHDMMPISYEQQRLPFVSGEWTGDVWKTFVKFRQTHTDLTMFTLDTDMGIGIILRGQQELLKITEEINYENFEKQKFEWLNVVSMSKFYTNFLNINTYSNLLIQFIDEPENALLNFYLGLEYQNNGQTAAAVSFYLRAAERTNELLLRYECLLRSSICFDIQGSRGNSVIGLLQHAVSILPNRPEAYYLLSKYYEKAEKWFDGYMIASIGVSISFTGLGSLRTGVGYPGYYGLLFEKAVLGWWCGLCSESLEILKNLSHSYIMDEDHKAAVINNLKNLGGTTKPDQFLSYLKNKTDELESSNKNLQLYTPKDFNKVKFKFKNLENVQRNYAEAFQDFLVLALLDGKKEGYYLEIGTEFPFYANNTYLLESDFNWNGISLDIKQESVERYFYDRKNQVILKDATQADYKKLLTESNAPNVIDYLQLDYGPPNVTYDILTKIPFSDYTFKIITYEHDQYTDVDKPYREMSRDFLCKLGYVLLISNVSTNGVNSFEDWWIHPSLKSSFIDKLKDVSSLTKTAKNIFISN